MTANFPDPITPDETDDTEPRPERRKPTECETETLERLAERLADLEVERQRLMRRRVNHCRKLLREGCTVASVARAAKITPQALGYSTGRVKRTPRRVTPRRIDWTGRA